MRFFLGDIRDANRLKDAMEGIDVVVHAAALKQVPAAEYNPIEFIKTNVIGSENVIQAALASNVKKVVALSTDKAAAPINLYGATKLCSDKLFIAANNIKGSRNISFSVVRYGNVMGSRGSVMPFFLKIAAQNRVLPITHPEMTRFNITLAEGVDMVFWALNHAVGGELLVPKIPSYKIIDVANAISPDNYEIVGIRPGEKIHEEMITSSDSASTYDIGDYFMILPPSESEKIARDYTNIGLKPVKVSEGFSYNSGENHDFLSIDQIKELIVKNVS